jgi:hypothetical protein
MTSSKDFPETDFSMNIDVTPGSGFKPIPDRVAFDLCKAYPANGGNLLIHNTRTSKRVMVKPEVYATLVSCIEFQTLDQHVANIIDRHPSMQGQQANVRDVLQSMLDSGIMVSASQISESLKEKPKATPDQNHPVVAIITWERPQALERLLESVAANCDCSKVQRFYVIDDSREQDNISQNQALVESFASQLEAPLHYFGQKEQQSLLSNLSKKLPQHEDAIHFLADQSRWHDHWTSGLARNLALLLSCGDRLVMLDDDSICDVYNPALPKPNISFSDDPREAEFFAEESDWATWHQPLNPDPIDRHMQCLGLPFSQAVNVLGQQHLKPAGLTNATALLTSELKKDSPVLMTECGSLGCPGTSSNTWLPDMASASLQRMLASKLKTSNALNKRMLWSGRNQPHFAPRPNMSQITGFDNRQMLPPYFPIERGEDRLFGNMLDFVFPSAVTLDYPWAIPHLPMPQRHWEEKDRDFSRGDSFPMFFVEQVVGLKSTCLASTPTERLNSLANWFNEMADASTESLQSMYRDSRLQSGAELSMHLTSLLNEDDSAQSDWQEYLKNGIQALSLDMDKASREDFPTKGRPENMESTELIGFWQNTWSGYAAALKAWPDIREAAADILRSD